MDKGDEGEVGLMLVRLVAGMEENVLVRIERVIMGNVFKAGLEVRPPQNPI